MRGGPTTMSTTGARRMISAPSAWATQPATAMRISRPSRAARPSDAQPPELGVDLLGGLLADMAGVEDDEIGILGAAVST